MGYRGRTFLLTEQHNVARTSSEEHALMPSAERRTMLRLIFQAAVLSTASMPGTLPAAQRG